LTTCEHFVPAGVDLPPPAEPDVDESPDDDVAPVPDAVLVALPVPPMFWAPGDVDLPTPTSPTPASADVACCPLATVVVRVTVVQAVARSARAIAGMTATRTLFFWTLIEGPFCM
jgi:hypothetical protein